MKNRLFYILFFALLLALSRIIPHPPNFTPIIASSIMAPILFKDRMLGMAVPIVGMFLSDIFLGFHPYQFVIYCTMLTISLVTPMKKNYMLLSLMAIGSSIWFFITTNFAVWIVWDYYPKTIDGLIECYTMAIPFFRNTLLSTCIFTGFLAFFIKSLEILNFKLIKD